MHQIRERRRIDSMLTSEGRWWGLGRGSRGAAGYAIDGGAALIWARLGTLGNIRRMDRIFGGNPLAVILRLVVISIIVGIVLTALGIAPNEIFAGLRRLVRSLSNLGFDAVHKVIEWLIIGAAVVVPIWLLLRLLGLLRGSSRPNPGGRSDPHG